MKGEIQDAVGEQATRDYATQSKGSKEEVI